MSPPATSEKRRVFRVSLAGALLNAKLEERFNCALLDGNSEGFAVLYRVPLRVGKTVKVELRYGSETYRGRACVRNVRKLGAARFRCGFQTCPNEQQLRLGLRTISIAVQRARLRRDAEREAL